jgi:hypothetical protein
MAKLKRTHNDLQNTIQNTKDQATRLQLSDDGRYILVRRVWRYQREVIRICTSKDRQHNGQKKRDKQRSTKHTSNNTITAFW